MPHVYFSYKGNIEDKQVVLAQSGIGKVNAAITATLLINEFKPDLIINTGSAGSVDSELNIGDIIISNKVYYHDVNATAFGYKLGQVPSMPEFYETDKELIDYEQNHKMNTLLNWSCGEILR
ncbi:5'-methylthioadenosine/S-adenosylhomocysteine nucleosidase [Mammaliicoccus sciuri]